MIFRGSEKREGENRGQEEERKREKETVSSRGVPSQNPEIMSGAKTKHQMFDCATQAPQVNFLSFRLRKVFLQSKNARSDLICGLWSANTCTRALRSLTLMVNFKCNYVKHEYALTLGLNFCRECSNPVPYKSVTNSTKPLGIQILTSSQLYFRIFRSCFWLRQFVFKLLKLQF